MRFFSRPATGTASGSTFKANARCPVGASHSSHASPSTISASRLPTATVLVQATAREGAVVECIAGIIASDEHHTDQGDMAQPGGAPAADAADVAVAGHAEHAAPALP